MVHLPGERVKTTSSAAPWREKVGPPADFSLAHLQLECPDELSCAGLLGFLGQLIAVIQTRLLALFASLHAILRSNWTREVSAVALPRQWLQIPAFFCWFAGIPLLVGSMLLAPPASVAAGTATLLAGELFGAAGTWLIVRQVFTGPTSLAQPSQPAGSTSETPLPEPATPETHSRSDD